MTKRRSAASSLIFCLAWFVSQNVKEAVADGKWERVEEILAADQGLIVLDGTEKVSPRYKGKDRPVYGDWLVLHAFSEPETLNPYGKMDYGSNRILENMFESLLYMENTPPYRFKGKLAAANPAVSPDKLSFTFDIREDARFSDGRPVTSADVLFSFKVIKNPEVQLSGYMRSGFKDLKAVRQAGLHKITFVFGEPYFYNAINIGRRWILPEHYYDPDGLMDRVRIEDLIDGTWEAGPQADLVRRFAERFNRDFSRRVLGSGPYVLASSDNDASLTGKTVLDRNPNYWGSGRKDLPPSGFVDRLVFKVVVNPDAAFIELTNGNLDVLNMYPLPFKEKSWSPEFTSRFLKVVRYASGINYIVWNNAHPVFRDKRVRRAMTHLTPRKSIIRDLIHGLGVTIDGPVHMSRPEFYAGLEPLQYNRDRAVELLQAAGWFDTDGDGVLDRVVDGVKTAFRFEFLVPAGSQLSKDIGLVMQDELADVGIECRVREIDRSIFLQRLREREFEALFTGGGSHPAVPLDLYSSWHSSQVRHGGNYSCFENEEADWILERYRRTFDAERRISLYRRLQEILYEEQPYTFLFVGRGVTAYSRRFRGVNWYPSGWTEFLEWWVNPADWRYP
ncbi:MAG: hypothetical protein J4F39_13205 [Candidatus Latescibacteria bacterium]|nr:hypothetical protein [Candidatus Latescibacterota bacterium]